MLSQTFSLELRDTCRQAVVLQQDDTMEMDKKNITNTMGQEHHHKTTRIGKKNKYKHRQFSQIRIGLFVLCSVNHKKACAHSIGNSRLFRVPFTLKFDVIKLIRLFPRY